MRTICRESWQACPSQDYDEGFGEAVRKSPDPERQGMVKNGTIHTLGLDYARGDLYIPYNSLINEI